MRISESHVLVPLIEPVDYGSAGIDSDGCNLGLMSGLTAVFNFGAITGNSILKVYTGVTAAKTTAIAFSYRLGAAAYKVALADQWGAATAVASTGLTLTANTFKNKQMVVELDNDVLTADHSFVTFEVDSTASVLLLGVTGIGTTRYPGNLIPSVL